MELLPSNFPTASLLLSTVSAIQLIWRVLSITSRRTREFILRRQTHEYAQVMFGTDSLWKIHHCLFSKNMLPFAVLSWAWGIGSSSSRWERMWMSTSLQTLWSRLGLVSRRYMIYQQTPTEWLSSEIYFSTFLFYFHFHLSVNSNDSQLFMYSEDNRTGRQLRFWQTKEEED